MQSGKIKRDIFVRPPNEWTKVRGILWKLTKLPYGIAEAGRQWLVTIETWLITSMQFESVAGLAQLFIKRNNQQKIMLLVAKVTDDFLVAGPLPLIDFFMEKLHAKFPLGKRIVDARFHFNGALISRHNTGDMSIDMNEYLSKIEPIPLTRERRKQRNHTASQAELQKYRRLAGILIFLGNGTLPQAAYIASYMQQKTGHLKVGHLSDANRALKELQKLTPMILYLRPTSSITQSSLISFSDAAFNVSSAQSYGQSGMLTGIFFETKDMKAYHIIDWHSAKQRRVSYSSFGAEILACADADNRGFNLRQGLRLITRNASVEHQLNVDSRALYDTITTLHEGKDYRLRQTVQRIRDSFESRDLNVLRWLPGAQNIADALTKQDLNQFRHLNSVCINGKLQHTLDNGYALSSSTWL